MGHILVVDDEPAIVAVVCGRLEQEGFAVRAVASGEEALAHIDAEPSDLMVLDVMLPGIDGFEVLRRLRGAGCPVPVIMLTARDEDVDKIVGLELGADDYLAKPFNPRELSARIRAVLRRQAELKALQVRMQEEGEPAERLRFDHPRRQVWFLGQPLELRPKEYDLLHFLARHRGQVFSRDALLSHVWGLESYIGERTVDVHVRRLRKALAAVDPDAQVILTEWGVGYQLLTATYLLTTLLVLIVLSVVVYFSTSFYLDRRLETELDAQADFYAAYAASLAADEWALSRLAPTMASLFAPQADLTVRFFSANNGALLAATQDIGPEPSRVALRELHYRSPAVFTPSSRDLPHRRYAARQIAIGGETIGVVEVSRSTLPGENFLTTLRTILLAAVLLAALASLLVSVFLARWLSGPIREMERATQHIAAGDLDVRLGDYSPDEVGRLARSIDHMAGRLKHLESARAVHRRDLPRPAHATHGHQRAAGQPDRQRRPGRAAFARDRRAGGRPTDPAGQPTARFLPLARRAVEAGSPSRGRWRHRPRRRRPVRRTGQPSQRRAERRVSP
jgi:DNA-binding response OmpR family regulator/HAMP domain-containing protein